MTHNLLIGFVYLLLVRYILLVNRKRLFIYYTLRLRSFEREYLIIFHF